MSEYLVDIKDERLSFFTPAGEVKALGGVSIHLKEGEVLGIVGESGSGKSVTAYSLMGLTAYPGRLIGGTLDFNGHHINDMSEKEMRRIRGNEVSIIFQDPMTSLNPVYTIGNQIREVILLHTGKSKKEANERAKELLTLVGINEPEKRLKQYPHELSGGMRQRVMIAIALACEPKLLIACGTEACSGGLFAESRAIDRRFFQEHHVDLWLPGAPMHPMVFIDGIRTLLGHKKRD